MRRDQMDTATVVLVILALVIWLVIGVVFRLMG